MDGYTIFGSGTCGNGVVTRAVEAVVAVTVCVVVIVNGSGSCNVGVVAVKEVAEEIGWNGKDNGKLSNVSSTGCGIFDTQPSERQESFEKPVSLVEGN